MLKLPMGFEPIKSIKGKRRLIMSLSAREKQGKTHFALTAPDPLAFFSLDLGTDGVLQKFQDRKIFVSEYDYRNAGGFDISVFQSAWGRLKGDFLTVLKNPDIRTIVWDTATEVWEMMRMAAFGKLTQVKPHHYGPVNAEYRDLLRLAYGSDKNLILLHKMKAEYVEDRRTGKFERAGFSDTGFLVQLNAVAWRDKDGTFGITVQDSRQRPELAGEEITEPLLSFPFLASQVFPDTLEEDWR
jgi:hypothetical protein